MTEAAMEATQEVIRGRRQLTALGRARELRAFPCVGLAREGGTPRRRRRVPRVFESYVTSTVTRVMTMVRREIGRSSRTSSYSSNSSNMTPFTCVVSTLL